MYQNIRQLTQCHSLGVAPSGDFIKRSIRTGIRKEILDPTDILSPLFVEDWIICFVSYFVWVKVFVIINLVTLELKQETQKFDIMRTPNKELVRGFKLRVGPREQIFLYLI